VTRECVFGGKNSVFRLGHQRACSKAYFQRQAVWQAQGKFTSLLPPLRGVGKKFKISPAKAFKIKGSIGFPIDPFYFDGVPKGIPLDKLGASSLPCCSRSLSERPTSSNPPAKCKKRGPTEKSAAPHFLHGVPKGSNILRVYNLSTLFHWNKSISLPPKKFAK